MAIKNEFELIQRYFVRPQPTQCGDSGVVIAIGDDCALTELPAGYQLAITTDTMVENTHFLPSISPADLAYKAVTTNLSDLAAMGARPMWISLALTLPHINENWLAGFSRSLFAVLADYQVRLIGGDTTKGPLSITITAQGIVPKEKALYRHQAKAGDLIYVSGTLGDSAAGLQAIFAAPPHQTSVNQAPLSSQSAVDFSREFLIQRHLRPTPRVALGLALRTVANAALDISDGLTADLSHILERSGCAAELELSQLPMSDALLNYVGREQAERYALIGGEDYELCFTVPTENRAAIARIAAETGVACTCIGRVIAESKIPQLVLLRHGKPAEVNYSGGFDHFKERE